MSGLQNLPGMDSLAFRRPLAWGDPEVGSEKKASRIGIRVYCWGSNVNRAARMNFFEYSLWALAAFLTAITGIFLFRDSLRSHSLIRRHWRAKARTLGAIVTLSSLIAIGLLCAILWENLGFPAAAVALVLYLLATAVGHRAIRSVVAWQSLINATIGVWLLLWLAVDGARISAAEIFLLASLLAWIVTSLVMAWRSRSRCAESLEQGDHSRDTL